MSAEFMQRAFEVCASDARLTPADKLVLLRWAWKTPDPARPYVIKFKTVARELSLSRNAVKACVARLVSYGYLYAVAVQVVVGPAFQTREAIGGQGVTPLALCARGQPVTPEGSVSDPQRGQPVTPIKKKKEKEGAGAEPRASQAARPLPDGRGPPVPDVGSLSAFQLSELRAGRSIPMGKAPPIPAGSPVHQALALAERAARG